MTFNAIDLEVTFNIAVKFHVHTTMVNRLTNVTSDDFELTFKIVFAFCSPCTQFAILSARRLTVAVTHANG